MNFKLKALVASLALVTASSAFAAITTTDELFLNIYDANNGVTFVKDLGVLGSNLINGTVAPQTWNFGTDANWTSFTTAASASANWIYNVVSVGLSNTNVTTYSGILSSPKTSDEKSMSAVVTPYINAVADAMGTGSTYTYVKTGATDATDFGYGFQSNWVGKLGTVNNSTGDLNTNLSFVQLTPGASNLAKSLVKQGPAGEFFQLSASGALTLQPIAVVPEPSEWALLFGGLLCVGAIARRRSIV